MNILTTAGHKMLQKYRHAIVPSWCVCKSHIHDHRTLQHGQPDLGNKICRDGLSPDDAFDIRNRNIDVALHMQGTKSLQSQTHTSHHNRNRITGRSHRTYYIPEELPQNLRMRKHSKPHVQHTRGTSGHKEISLKPPYL